MSRHNDEIKECLKILLEMYSNLNTDIYIQYRYRHYEICAYHVEPFWDVHADRNCK